MKTLLAIALVLGTLAVALGGPCWGGGISAPVGAARRVIVFAKPAPAYSWARVEGAPNQRALYLGDKQIGSWDAAHKQYRPIAGGRWGKPVTAPPIPAPKVKVIADQMPIADPPKAAAVEPADAIVRGPTTAELTGFRQWQLDGVHLEKIEDRPKCTVNGKEIPCSQAAAAVSGKDVPDDADKLHLTVLGSVEERKPIMEDLDSNPDLKWAKAAFRIQGYSRDDPLLSHYNFDSASTVVVQKPDGEVLWNQPGYKAGPKALAETLAKIHKDYDPKKDPGPSNQPAGNWLLWVAIGLGVLLILKN